MIFCFAWSTFISLGRAIMWLLHTCASHLIAIVNKDGQTSTTDEPRPFPISSMQVCKCISLRVYQHLIQHTHAYIHTQRIQIQTPVHHIEHQHNFPHQHGLCLYCTIYKTCTRYTTYMYFDMNLQRSYIYVRILCVSLFPYYLLSPSSAHFLSFELI